KVLLAQDASDDQESSSDDAERDRRGPPVGAVTSCPKTTVWRTTTLRREASRSTTLRMSCMFDSNLEHHRLSVACQRPSKCPRCTSEMLEGVAPLLIANQANTDTTTGIQLALLFFILPMTA